MIGRVDVGDLDAEAAEHLAEQGARAAVHRQCADDAVAGGNEGNERGVDGGHP
jgi:hypothetical protein